MSTEVQPNPIIVFRKNSKSSTNKDKRSIMILETKEKKITVNLKDDVNFLNKKDFKKNISIVKSSVSNMESGHFSDRSLVRIQKATLENLPIDKIDKMDIEKKEQEILNKSKEIIEGQENGPETPVDTDAKHEGVNLIKQCETFQIDGINMNNIDSADTQRDNINIEYGHKVPPSYPQIKLITNNNGSHVIYNPPSIENDIKSKDFESSEKLKYDHLNEEPTFEYFKLCYICDKLHLTTSTFSSLGCEHAICLKCGKTFYEDKIEQGEGNLKCPIYNCQACPEISFIKTILSDKHSETLMNLLERGESNVEMSKRKSNTFFEVKVYTQKHVFDVNTNDTFFTFNQTKDQFCIKCGEPSLYGRTGKSYVKCLNCYNTICKFCMKAYSYDHLDITSLNYCKVYFRKTLKKNIEKQSNLKIFLLTYLMMIPSFTLLFCAMFTYIADIISYVLLYKNKTNAIFKVIFFLMYFISIIIMFPVFILLIPYFPILIAIFK
jgi:hypothetical protein